MQSEDTMQQTVLRSTRLPRLRDQLRHNLARQWPQAYATILGVSAALGAVFPFLFPTLTLWMLVSAGDQLAGLGSGFSANHFIMTVSIGVFAGAVTGYLWNERMSLPRGRRLDAKDAPLLFPLLADLQRQFGAPAFDQILLTTEHELRTLSTPSRGLPLKLRTTLVIGLPLLDSLSTTQIQVLLAREVGYLSQARRRPAAWLLVLDDVATCYYDHFHSGWGPQQILLRLFYRGFAPVYHWLSQDHARREQRLSNRYAMELINDEVVAQALVSSHFAQYILRHQFWPAIYKTAQRHPAPKHPPYGSMEAFMHRAHQKGVTEYWLNHVLGEYASTDRSPTLREHLEEIGHHRILPPQGFDQPASRQLMPARLDTIHQQMDRRWLHENLDAWKRRHAESRGEWEHMKRLIARAQNSAISAGEAWECARLIQQNLSNQADVGRYYKQLLVACPGCAKLHYFIGRHLLAGNDAEGVLAVERAMQLEHEYVQEGCQLITRYLLRNGRRQEAQEYRRRALAHEIEDAA